MGVVWFRILLLFGLVGWWFFLWWCFGWRITSNLLVQVGASQEDLEVLAAVFFLGAHLLGPSAQAAGSLTR